MGWETDFLQQAVDTCTNLSGQIQDCPLFNIQDESKGAQCKIKMPEVLAKEKMVDAMTSLPGNVAIMAGPAYAKGAAPAQEGTTIAEASTTAEASSSIAIPTYAPGTKLPSGSQYVPGAVFAAKATTSPSVSAAAAPPAAASAPASVESAIIAPLPTPAPAGPPPAATSVQTYFSTEYRTQGSVVNEILWVQKVETVTASQTTTVAAAPKHKRHSHRAHGRSLHH
jgi:hypothetical protein